MMIIIIMCMYDTRDDQPGGALLSIFINPLYYRALKVVKTMT